LRASRVTGFLAASSFDFAQDESVNEENIASRD